MLIPYYTDHQHVSLLHGDMLEVLAQLPKNCVDAVITDPPYEISFMSSSWDNSGVSFSLKTWEHVYRVLKPGGHLLAFGGSRTFHRIWCAIEDAGFEIRDTIMWIYSQGFPKGIDISKSTDKIRPIVSTTNSGGFKRIMTTNAVVGYRPTEYDLANNPDGNEFTSAPPVLKEADSFYGWNTTLKPAFEPIILVRKPISEKSITANVLKYGTGAINIGVCRIGNEQRHNRVKGQGINTYNYSKYTQVNSITGTDVVGRYPANIVFSHSLEYQKICEEKIQDSLTILDVTSAKGINWDVGGRKESFQQRKNADTYSEIIDGYKCVSTCPVRALNEQYHKAPRFFNVIENEIPLFIYNPKASVKDRVGVSHPTMKPIKLMEHLVKLVTPSSGIVLDPFCGAGTTVIAAKNLGFKSIGVEINQEYCDMTVYRLKQLFPNRFDS